MKLVRITKEEAILICKALENNDELLKVAERIAKKFKIEVKVGSKSSELLGVCNNCLKTARQP